MACQAGKDFYVFKFLGILREVNVSSLDPVADDAALADALANDEPAVDLREDESVLSSFGRRHAGDV